MHYKCQCFKIAKKANGSEFSEPFVYDVVIYCATPYAFFSAVKSMEIAALTPVPLSLQSGS